MTVSVNFLNIYVSVWSVIIIRIWSDHVWAGVCGSTWSWPVLTGSNTIRYKNRPASCLPEWAQQVRLWHMTQETMIQCYMTSPSCISLFGDPRVSETVFSGNIVKYPSYCLLALAFLSLWHRGGYKVLGQVTTVITPLISPVESGS